MGFSEASESINSSQIVSLTDSRVFRVHHHRHPHLQLLKNLTKGRFWVWVLKRPPMEKWRRGAGFVWIYWTIQHEGDSIDRDNFDLRCQRREILHAREPVQTPSALPREDVGNRSLTFDCSLISIRFCGICPVGSVPCGVNNSKTGSSRNVSVYLPETAVPLVVQTVNNSTVADE